MDEVRAVTAVVSDPHLLVVQAIRFLRWLKGFFVASSSDSVQSRVEVVSSGPPRRALDDILRDPPKLRLVGRELQVGDYLVGRECTGPGCATCFKLSGVDVDVDEDLPLRAS